MPEPAWPGRLEDPAERGRGCPGAPLGAALGKDPCHLPALLAPGKGDLGRALREMAAPLRCPPPSTGLVPAGPDPALGARRGEDRPQEPSTAGAGGNSWGRCCPDSPRDHMVFVNSEY